jgi:hypothetical protein
MVRLCYLGPHDGVEVPELAIAVARDGTVDADNELATRLLQQPCWSSDPDTVLALAATPELATLLREAETRRPSPRPALLAELTRRAAPADAAPADPAVATAVEGEPRVPGPRRPRE